MRFLITELALFGSLSLRSSVQPLWLHFPDWPKLGWQVSNDEPAPSLAADRQLGSAA